MTVELQPPPEPDVDELLLGFARALRAAGLHVTADRERTFLIAAATVGMGERAGVYWAGRATLTSTPADFPTYDELFERWFGGESIPKGQRVDIQRPPVSQAPLDSGEGQAGDGDTDSLQARASAQEVLRHRDVATLSAADRAAAARLFASLDPRSPLRRARRHVRARSGAIDGPATLRDQLRRMGEPGRIHHRRRGTRPRRIVLLIDVSGSMSAYADSLLRLAHVFVRTVPHVEVFTMGTRLTHVTRALTERDPDRALAAAGRVVPDWSAAPASGTRSARSSTAGAGGVWPAAPSSLSSPTAGNARDRRCSASRCAGSPPSRTGSCGSTRTAGRSATRRCSKGSSRPCRTSTTSSPGTRSRRSRS